MIKVRLYFTTSKFAAYIILAIGSVFSFWLKDAGTLLATFSSVSAILMLKSYTQSKTEQAQINNNITPPSQVPPDQV